ncbi:hypothetical protein BH09BAC6_BH09BAC6_24570 [soil metagenome]|jgi:hypothetical protein
MGQKRFTQLFIPLIFMLMAAFSACQKDSDVKDPAVSKTSVAIDSTALLNTGNFLAAKGILKITINDSTYTFDAAQDSIAFINERQDGDKRYYGLTAINKAHTMSFGISSAGFVYSNTSSAIAGSQFLLMADEKAAAVQQYTLSRFVGKDDFGKISVDKYNQGNVLAKGTFFTFLATDDKATSPFYRVDGSFDLQLK